MPLSRTLLWSSTLAGSLFLALASMAGCSDDVDVDPIVDGGGSSSSSGGSSSGGSSSSSGGSSSGGDAGGDAGTSIPIPEGATLRWTSKGGFPSYASDASTCEPSDDLYTYDLGTKKLAWRLCRSTAVAPEVVYAFQDGTAVLTAEQDGAVRTALAGVVPNAATACGNDKPTLQLVFIAPNDAETTYYDQFYHCEDDGKTYVNGLGEVGHAFANVVAPEE